jgi:hypothetical protein
MTNTTALTDTEKGSHTRASYHRRDHRHHHQLWRRMCVCVCVCVTISTSL